ncbi:MAG: N-acetylglucosamine kinase [Bacteroidales bacterium]|nr:N-acetylglucosamine kinase [Bacteroidales bacterium]
MILIADSGSTKTDWACVSKDGCTRIDFKSLGYNPNYISGDEIEKDILDSLPVGFPKDKVHEIHFYGAGVTELQYDFMREVLKRVFTNASEVFIAMDLLASARALLGREAGFAAILGTGTNSCLYDGTDITLNIDSLGFILGDEGSGGYIGKALIRDFIRFDQPEEVRKEVAELLGKNGDELIDQIYTKPFPNRYCAQFCRFVGDNRFRHPYYHDLLKSSFKDFFDKIVCHYPDYKSMKLNCVGSVGYFYKDVLKEAADEAGMELGRIIRAPLDDLVKYHTIS